MNLVKQQFTFIQTVIILTSDENYPLEAQMSSALLILPYISDSGSYLQVIKSYLIRVLINIKLL